MLFEIRDLKKTYGDRTVLDIVEMNFERGIIYSLLGPNGSGKTTLLEILSLLIPPTTGKIIYNGKIIDFKGNNLPAIRREVVMVQQNPVLFTTSIYKNMEFGLKIRGVSKQKREKIIEESLDLVGMRDFISMDAYKLSGGETQRVAIAQALACSPKVMFFDEPTTNVDVENKVAIERIFKHINSQKKISVIFTTHDLFQASQLSRNVISLFEGRVAPSIFENIFSGDIIWDKNGSKSCLIQEKIRLLIETEKTGNVRLSIDPMKIEIKPYQDIHSEKNINKGRLIQLTVEHDQVRAVADIGILLNILLPKKELQEKCLYVGDEVMIFCPMESIWIF